MREVNFDVSFDTLWLILCG